MKRFEDPYFNSAYAMKWVEHYIYNYDNEKTTLINCNFDSGHDYSVYPTSRAVGVKVCQNWMDMNWINCYIEAFWSALSNTNPNYDADPQPAPNYYTHRVTFTDCSIYSVRFAAYDIATPIFTFNNCHIGGCLFSGCDPDYIVNVGGRMVSHYALSHFMNANVQFNNCKFDLIDDYLRYDNATLGKITIGGNYWGTLRFTKCDFVADPSPLPATEATNSPCMLHWSISYDTDKGWRDADIVFDSCKFLGDTGHTPYYGLNIIVDSTNRATAKEFVLRDCIFRDCLGVRNPCGTNLMLDGCSFDDAESLDLNNGVTSWVNCTANGNRQMKLTTVATTAPPTVYAPTTTASLVTSCCGRNDMCMYASFAHSQNLDFTRASAGVVPSTVSGTVRVTPDEGLLLEPNSTVAYTLDANCDTSATGCFRFTMIPSWTSDGTHNTHIFWMGTGALHNGTNSSQILFVDTSNSVLYFQSSTGQAIATYYGIGGFTAYNSYEYELNWDLAAGNVWLYKNGTRAGLTTGVTGFVRNSPTALQLGHTSAFARQTRFKNVELFSTPQHPYTQTTYSVSSARLPLMDVASYGPLIVKPASTMYVQSDLRGLGGLYTQHLGHQLWIKGPLQTTSSTASYTSLCTYTAGDKGSMTLTTALLPFYATLHMRCRGTLSTYAGVVNGRFKITVAINDVKETAPVTVYESPAASLTSGLAQAAFDAAMVIKSVPFSATQFDLSLCGQTILHATAATLSNAVGRSARATCTNGGSHFNLLTTGNPTSLTFNAFYQFDVSDVANIIEVDSASMWVEWLV